MPVLPIYLYGQPVLRKKAKPVRRATAELRALVEDMFETMDTAGGIGLAAPQGGSLERVIVVDASDMEETHHLPDGHPGHGPIAMVNPEVISAEGAWVMEEGCLRIPEIRDEVERPERIVVRYRDADLKEHEIEAERILARVILHEVDHQVTTKINCRLPVVKQIPLLVHHCWLAWQWVQYLMVWICLTLRLPAQPQLLVMSTPKTS